MNLNQAREYLLTLLPQAGEILKKYFVSGEFTFQSKGGFDFLTQADEEVDLFLREGIKKQFPGTQLLTEETAPKDHQTLKEIKNLWVIDPLDGTINFSRGNPHFAISVGLVDKGISKFGVVLVPLENKLYWAEQDQENVFLNGEPIKVSTTENLEKAVMACDWTWDLEKRLKVVTWLNKSCSKVLQIKQMGSAVADLADLAAGKLDIYLHSGLKPWDVAACTLFIEKAGGRITTPSGEKWNVFNPEMLASNGFLHTKILDLIS
ncbi:inositol monophosphatase family protein [Candidatus Daviesbacteria bacterium]|nr:inositol monophosphatase family protein [Candidatus Daviesbacteria bacterium]